MIQKIKSFEYMKRYESMNTEERRVLCDRVGQWLRSGGRRLLQLTDGGDSRLQNVIQVSVGWNDADSQEFNDGARLLTAFVGKADTWLPDMLYVKSASRAVKQIINVLTAQIENGKFRIEKRSGMEVVTSVTSEERRVQVVTEVKKPAEDAPATDGDRKVTPPTNDTGRLILPVGGVPVRPKHIDQYVHLLPESTQKKAAMVQGLLCELDQARENMRLMMNDPHASGNDHAKWATAAKRLDDKLKAIYKELDSEWEKIVADGRVIVDDLGNSHVVPSKQPAELQGEEAPQENIELTSEQKYRRRELRKWLVDIRRGAEGKAREKRIEQWKVNILEYLSLEGDAAFNDEKIIEAAKHFDINVEEFKETKNRI